MVMLMHCCISTLLCAVTLSPLLQSWGVLSHEEEHGQGHHGKPLQFASEIHNAEHILEHLQNVLSTKPKEQMSEEELEFHYFKLHDYDNNNKLDGVEIGKALTHFHDGKDKTREGMRPARAYSDEELSEVIDAALRSDDLDGDGYVEYPEFMASQARRLEEDMALEGHPPAYDDRFEEDMALDRHQPAYDDRGAHAPGHGHGLIGNPPGV